MCLITPSIEGIGFFIKALAGLAAAAAWIWIQRKLRTSARGGEGRDNATRPGARHRGNGGDNLVAGGREYRHDLVDAVENDAADRHRA